MSYSLSAHVLHTVSYILHLTHFIHLYEIMTIHEGGKICLTLRCKLSSVGILAYLRVYALVRL